MSVTKGKTSMILWLPNGHTLKFENVRLFVEEDDYILFTYDGVDTHTTRDASFQYKMIAGWAMGKEGVIAERYGERAERAKEGNLK